MEFDFKRTVQISAYLLLVLAVTQALYTALYVAQLPVPRQLLWGLETVLFTFLAALAGAALVQAKTFHLGWSAIAFSAVLNVVQVSIGLALFGPFREVAAQLETFAPAAESIVAVSFLIYYAAKVLLGFAALVFGMAVLKEGSSGLGRLTVGVAMLAMVANTTLILFSREGFLPSPVAGGSGVLATFFLGVCLLKLNRQA